MATEIRFLGPSSGSASVELLADPELCLGVETRRLAVEVPGSATVDTSACPSWHLACSGEKFCSESLTELADGEAVVVDVHPATRVHGRIEVERHLDLPRRARVSGRTRGTPEIEFAFGLRVGEDGVISFNAPAGTIDLRLAADKLAPSYRWNVRPADGVADLGRLLMVPGGSMLGYVVDADTGLPVPEATIAALPAGTENLPTSDREARAGIPPASARTDDRGSFQLLSLAPGPYRLKAEHPDYLSAESGEIHVVRNSETVLGGNILLSPPLSLRLRIDPPRSPAGHRWAVSLREPLTDRDVGSTETDDDGIAEFGSLAPASLEVRVDAEDVRGAFKTDLEIEADLELPVALPIVEVVGQVTMNDEPVQGTLAIETGAGDRWGTDLDAEGAFTTWIREPSFDFLFLTVNGDGFASPAEITVEELVVDEDKIELNVDLVDLEISGRVVSLRGRPVRGALVIARRGRAIAAKVYSEEDGSFSMRPLQAAEYQVRAISQGYGASREEVLALGEVSPVLTKDLIIRPSRRIRGRLRGPSDEPLGGARIVFHSVGPEWVSATVTTDIDGRFSAEVASDVNRAVVIVTAPGYPFWSACVDSTSELSIQLPPAGGDLEIQILRNGDSGASLTHAPLLVNETGGFASLDELYRWMRQHGEVMPNSESIPLLVPNVAPGRWAVVWTAASPADIIVPACTGALQIGSEGGLVTPGATTQLLLDLRD